jgi:ribosomal protein L16 Arg81 hydroxylase
VITLADFFGPFDRETFRAEYFGRRPLHIKRGNHPLPDILNWRRFNEALAITPFWDESTLKLYFKTREALRDSYCDPVEAGARKAPVNPAKVKALISLGASVVANHLHRICPEIGRVTRLLEKEFAARSFANAYCSFKGVQAFQTHYDLHDVFAFQAEGEKVWRVYEARADAPVKPVPPGDEAEQWLIQSRGQVLFEASMQPGDVLYLPRGQFHDALTGSQASLHVTFGVSPPTGLALFELLEKAAAGESAFRAYLPDASNEAALRERLTQLGDRLKEIIVSPAFAIDVLNHQRSQHNPVADYDLPRQTPPDWYSPVKKAQVVRRDDGFYVVFDGGELAVGALQPTVEWMLQQRHFSREGAAARQPDFSASELSLLLERLLKAGVLAISDMRR